jgi:hypothetical protein
MGRYLLVEIDRNDTAERLRAQIDNAGKGMRVVGMFSKAATLCDCEVPSEQSIRGAKLGWRICPECRKAKTAGAQTLYNMLDDPETPTKYRELWIGVRWVWRDGVVATLRSVARKDWR